MRIAVVSELAEVIIRIRNRGTLGMTILTDPKGQPLKEFGWFRSQFDKARKAAEEYASEKKLPATRLQLRNLRAKATTDLEDMKRAQKLIDHTAERLTATYIHDRIGDVVQPLERRKWKEMAKEFVSHFGETKTASAWEAA